MDPTITAAVESIIDSIIEKALKASDGIMAPFAVIDADNTIWARDVGEGFLYYLARMNYRGKWRQHFETYQGLIAQCKTEEAYRFGAEILEDMSVYEIEDATQAMLFHEGQVLLSTTLFDHTVPRGIKPRTHIVELMDCLHGRGFKIHVVSASPEAIVKTALKYFSLSQCADDVIGVRNKIEGGFVTAALETPTPIGQGKVACIKELIHSTQQPALGIGDSMGDYPMLLYSNVRVVVDRGNALANAAKANHDGTWFILPE